MLPSEMVAYSPDSAFVGIAVTSEAYRPWRPNPASQADRTLRGVAASEPQ